MVDGWEEKRGRGGGESVEKAMISLHFNVLKYIFHYGLDIRPIPDLFGASPIFPPVQVRKKIE